MKEEGKCMQKSKMSVFKGKCLGEKEMCRLQKIQLVSYAQNTEQIFTVHLLILSIVGSKDKENRVPCSQVV